MEPANDNGGLPPEGPGITRAPSHTYIETSCTAIASGLPAIDDASIDVIISDPPYSQHVHTRARQSSPGSAGKRKKGVIAAAREFDFDYLTPDVMHFAALHFARIVKRWVLVFCDVESSSAWSLALRLAGLEYVRTLAWVKGAGTPQFTGDRPAAGFEAIVLAHPPGKKRWNGGGRPGVYNAVVQNDRTSKRPERGHTAQKPLLLMEALVRDFSDRGETILDAFGGAATTGVAAKRLGRGFVGMEKDPYWFKVGARRLLRTREQLELALLPVRVRRAKQEVLAL